MSYPYTDSSVPTYVAGDWKGRQVDALRNAYVDQAKLDPHDAAGHIELARRIGWLESLMDEEQIAEARELFSAWEDFQRMLLADE